MAGETITKGVNGYELGGQVLRDREILDITEGSVRAVTPDGQVLKRIDFAAGRFSAVVFDTGAFQAMEATRNEDGDLIIRVLGESTIAGAISAGVKFRRVSAPVA